VSDVDAVGAENRRRFVLELRDKFMRMSRMSPAELEMVVFAELQQVVSFAKKRIPWYTNEFPLQESIQRANSVTDLLEQLPILTRAQVQENFDGLYFKSPEHDESDYVMQATSGSTSKPVSVMKFGPLYSAEYDALTLTEWHLNKRDVTKLISSFRVIGKEARNAPLGPPLSYLGANRPSTALSVMEHSIEELLDELHQLRPDYLYVNGVVARQLASAQINSDRQPISVEQILTVSDRIDPQLRLLVDDAFGARIVDRYSSEEFGYIAFQCPVHDHLHVCSPSVVVEVVDDDGQPCAVGVAGRVLVTSLHNSAMPLIRYEIGDIAQFGPSCDSGLHWPVIERIVGRTRDGVTLPNGEFHLVTFFDSDMLKLRKLRDFQVVLFNDALVFVHFTESNLDEDEKAIIRNELLNVFQLVLPVIFRSLPADYWRTLWKRREWDQLDTNYVVQWTDKELMSALSSLVIPPRGSATSE